jgi:predicted DsbA family dithiol-disulfide isomerase
MVEPRITPWTVSTPDGAADIELHLPSHIFVLLEPAMPTTLKIDFVSDVSCPWCVIGLKALEQAADRLQGEVALDLHFQPFELNPQMGPAGQDINEHLQEKYGSTPEQLERNREAIAARGADLGFTFGKGKRSRVYNTFDAHRLLHWAEEKGLQPQLKLALFTTYFTDGQDPSSHEVLVGVAAEVGLNADEAREVLESGRYADEVREREQLYLQNGIHSVPAIIINDRHLIQGGQPVEVFEQALRQIAAQG